MPRDPRIDDYIVLSAECARPILEHLRELVHNTVPGAGEAIKWGMPHFTHKGKNVAGMAAFKEHCAFTIHGEGRHGGEDGMGSCGKLAALAELPPDEVLAVAYGYAMRQLKYADTRKDLARALTRNTEAVIGADFHQGPFQGPLDPDDAFVRKRLTDRCLIFRNRMGGEEPGGLKPLRSFL